MLKKITKKTGGTVRERYLSTLAEKSFIGLWSYPSVFRDQGLSTTGTGKEVADLLLYFDGHVVLFSDKDIAFPEHADIKIAWGRWYRRSIAESAKQLYGAEKYLRENGARLFLDEKCEHPFPFDLSIKSLKFHLVAVTNNSDAPCREYFDRHGKGSTGSLVCEFRLDGKGAAENPFHAPDFDRSKTFVHVFDETTLDIVLGELDTTPDFLHYLTEKEKAVRGRGLVAKGEEDILGLYLSQPTANGYGSLRLPKADRGTAILVQEQFWYAYLASASAYQRNKIRKRAQLWTELTAMFSRHILDADVGEAADQPIQSHERAVRFMASENLTSRAILSSFFEDKFRTVPAGHHSSRCVRSLMDGNRAYIFMLYPRHSTEDYAQYREERTSRMDAYGLVLKYLQPTVRHVVIIGMESQGADGRSETILALDLSKPLSKEDKRVAHRLRHEDGILRDLLEEF